MSGLMEPRPPEEKPEGCPDCGWKEWETVVWTYTAVIAVLCLIIIIVGFGAPK